MNPEAARCRTSSLRDPRAGIGHGDGQSPARLRIVFPADPHGDLSRDRVLHRVGDQVAQHLPHLHGVAQNVRNFHVRFDAQHESLCLGLRAIQIGCFPRYRTHVRRHEIDADAFRFDLFELEEISDELKRRTQ